MSNPRITITLGRSGQVVERGGNDSDFAHGHNQVSGSKRSNGDRQGFGSTIWPVNKRPRGDGIKWRSAGNEKQDHQLSRNDLRLKLIRKRQPKQSLIGRDPHEAKLSNTVQTQQPLNRHIPQYKSEANGSASFRKMPSRESADDLHLDDSHRNPYSARVSNGLRHRSQDRTFRTLGISPPRNFDELWKVSPIRVSETSRPGRFPSRGVFSGPHPMGSVHIPMNGPSGTTKLVSHFPSVSIQQSSLMVDEPRTVTGLLHSLGLGKYAIIFQAEEVDMSALRQMGDKDLKDLGLPMGPRKKILLALLASRSKQQPQ